MTKTQTDSNNSNYYLEFDNSTFIITNTIYTIVMLVSSPFEFMGTGLLIHAHAGGSG